MTALQQRVRELEAELESAAATLQAVLPIGKVKAIGLRQVAAGCKLLADDHATLVAALRELSQSWRDDKQADRIDCIIELQKLLTALLENDNGK